MFATIEETLAVIHREVGKLGIIKVAVGMGHAHVLAEPVLWASDSPPFDRALLDGFAVRSVDARIGAQLQIVGKRDAGGVGGWDGAFNQGQCVAINTGAVFPAGADAVLMVEHSRTERPSDDGPAFVTVLREVRAENGVQRRGAHGRVGSVALAAGTVLNAAAIGGAVSAGAAELTVWRKPRVAVLSTGDELVAAGQPLGPGQIHNSNQAMLLALVKECNGESMNLGSCPDVREELRSRLETGLREADLLVVTGGMSMGTRDLVPALLKELGVEIHVEKVRMKPGKPFVFGTVGGSGACARPGGGWGGWGG